MSFNARFVGAKSRALVLFFAMATSFALTAVFRAVFLAVFRVLRFVLVAIVGFHIHNITPFFKIKACLIG